jgi:hypothetical protein
VSPEAVPASDDPQAVRVAARVAAAHSAGTRVRVRAEKVVFTRWTP